MLRCIIVLGLIILLTGCGEKGPLLVPVTGTVTLDGKPIEKASVTFMPAEGQPQPASGETDAQGKFKLRTTIGPKDYVGALPGKFLVIITKSTLSGATADANGLSTGVSPEGIKIEWIIPEKYSKTNTSELTSKVEPSMAPADFALKGE